MDGSPSVANREVPGTVKYSFMIVKENRRLKMVMVYSNRRYGLGNERFAMRAHKNVQRVAQLVDDRSETAINFSPFVPVATRSYQNWK